MRGRVIVELVGHHCYAQPGLLVSTGSCFFLQGRGHTVNERTCGRWAHVDDARDRRGLPVSVKRCAVQPTSVICDGSVCAVSLLLGLSKDGKRERKEEWDVEPCIVSDCERDVGWISRALTVFDQTAERLCLLLGPASTF